MTNRRIHATLIPCFLAGAASGQTAMIERIGPDAGPDSNAAVGLSADGTVVAGHVGGRPWVYDASRVGGPDPSLWFLTPIADGKTTVSLARNALASVGIGLGMSGLAGWRWNEAEGLVPMGCDGGGDPGSLLVNCVNQDISADGTLIVGVMNQDPLLGTGEAFEWTMGTGRVGLGFLPGHADGSSWARAVSDDGSTIVGHGAALFSTFQEAMYWDSSRTPHLIGMLFGGTQSFAYEVNPDGTVIAGAGDTFPPPGADVDVLAEAWIWRAGDEEPTSIGHAVASVPLPPSVPDGAILLSDFSFCEHRPRGMSADGSVVVGVAACERLVEIEGDRGVEQHGIGIELAWIWDASNGMRLLADALTNEYGVDLSAWDMGAFSRADDVTPDGTTIVGSAARSADGVNDAFVVRLAGSCPAELTGDDTLDVFDLLAYLALWFAEDPAADRNGDELTDVFDLLAYLSDWFAGC